MRALKIAVVIMGVILIAGFGVIIGRIVYLLNRPPATPAVAVTGGALPTGPKLARPLTLPAGAVIKSLSLAGDRLAVHYEAPTGAGIEIIDLAGQHPGWQIGIETRAPGR